MKKGSLYTIVYAAVLGVVCALLLTGTDAFVGPYREANEKAEEVRNILGVLGIPFDARSPSQELVETFDNAVRVEHRGDLTLYLFLKQDAEESVEAVAVPVAGPGLWGPIEGFISLEPDMRTIRGVTFYKQQETPGLGGEIASQWFQDQFKGKSIESEARAAGMRILRGGGATAQNEVDGITGATMTCDKLKAILNAVIEDIVKERTKDGG